MTALTCGCVRIVSASTRLHGTTLSTPRGKPASSYSRAKRRLVMGVVDAGLSTNVLPHTMASGAIQPMGIMAGKFHGAMPAHTPSASR